MAQRKGLFGRIVDAGLRTATEAAGAVLRDPRGQDAVARAVGVAQRMQKRVEELQARMMKVARVPGRREYDELAKQLARIKRKARELSAELERRTTNAAPMPYATPPASSSPASSSPVSSPSVSSPSVSSPSGPAGEEVRGPAAYTSAETPAPPPDAAADAGDADRSR
jgi:hypothetical protein